MSAKLQKQSGKVRLIVEGANDVFAVIWACDFALKSHEVLPLGEFSEEKEMALRKVSVFHSDKPKEET